MRTAWSLLLTAGLVGALPAQGPARETIERLKKATLFVRVTGRDLMSGRTTSSSGSGFFVSPHGHVLTNWHVVRPFGPGPLELQVPRRVSIQVLVESGTPREEALEATVIAVDKANDLAVLATGRQGAAFLELGEPGELYETFPLWVAGFPLGEKFAVIERGPAVTIGRGTVTALRHDDLGELRTLQTDAPFDPGNSGGPLIAASGKVKGVAQSIVVQNRSLNFAVPAHLAKALVDRAHLDRPWKAAGRVLFRAPARAEVYLDGKRAGRIDGETLSIETALGLRQVSVVHPEFLDWSTSLLLAPGTVVEPKLLRPSPKRVRLGPQAEAGALSREGLPEVGAKLLEQDFEEREALREMEQSTGGTPARTWYIQGGKLHQHELSGMLHAICFGDRDWTDYSFGAEVLIKNEDEDARAGLIFRETENGFYLFRIHRGTDRAELAYHSKRPFGWFILGRKNWGTPIGTRPHRLEVRASGPDLTCLLDGEPVFRVRDRLSSAGRVGFYSVESQAAFSEARVHAVTGGKPAETAAEQYPAFWFSDFFNEASAGWSSRRPDGSAASPWLLTDAGAAAVHGDPGTRLMLLETFSLESFQADLLVSLSPLRSAEDPAFGFVFGRGAGPKGPRHYEVLIAGRSTRLYRIEGEQRSLLHEAALASEEESHLSQPIERLALRVEGGSVLLHGLQRLYLRHELEQGVFGEGSFGVLTRGVDALFHQLTVSAPQPLRR